MCSILVDLAVSTFGCVFEVLALLAVVIVWYGYCSALLLLLLLKWSERNLLHRVLFLHVCTSSLNMYVSVYAKQSGDSKISRK